MAFYQYSDGETVRVDAGTLEQLLHDNCQLLQNYLDVFNDLDDPSYVARGNGFCDAKYSEDFIEHQIAKYRQRIQDVERWLQYNNNQ